ncbi:PKD domain protein [Pseudotenacibaculum sp. MALMAid0570]|uniref:PKD domain protein n=1 Tax=Pseudotenacibaculum sp. MALMAid0570 TaxID=3143938 RepID=UPI0032DF299D
MKLIKNIFKTVFIILVIISCDENRDLDFLDTIAPPTNVSATFDVTQDNTGVVTITPNADGANSYEVVFGDGSDNVTILAGESVEHTYAEGNYDVTIRAFNIKEDVTEATVPLVVSFMAPSNLVTTIENDAAISKQVNVTVTADYAVSYDFYSGEPGITDPVATANIGETVSYTYTNPGTYSLRIVVKGAAIQTTEYTEDFEVTEILQPIASAATPPTRNPQDVISIYGSEYDNVAGTDTFPDWGQAGQGSSWGTFTLNGDDMLQYTNLSYQGIQFGAPQDVSAMEYIHLDVWTSANADITRLETSLISVSNGEKPVWSDLTAGEWTSIDIPISDFTDQGLTVADIHQLKFVGDPWAAGTVFIDNIYFYKSPSSTVVSGIQDFEGTAPTFTVFGNIAATEVVANPDPTGANTTANVAKLTKTNGSEVWAGTFFEVGSPLDLTNFSKIRVKTWSPKNGAQVKLKLENADASVTYEQDLNTTVANAWEELTYDFSGAPAGDYVRIVIFFDFGNAGDDSLYYYDEIALIDDSGGPAPLSFQDFEGTAPTFTVFGNIAATEVVANPDATGVNTTANVAKLTKTNGSEVWAGTFFEVASPLDFNTYSKISVKTWSPKNGVVVKVKLENADASVTYEQDLNTSVANAWEELVYDFSGAPAGDYVRVVIFFDFGNPGDDSLYYFDEYTLTN